MPRKTDNAALAVLHGMWNLVRGMWNPVRKVTEWFFLAVGLAVILWGPPRLFSQLVLREELASVNIDFFDLILFAFYGLFLVSMFRLLDSHSRSHSEYLDGRLILAAAIFGISGAAYAMLATGDFLVLLTQRGVVISFDPPQTGITVGQLHGKLLHEALSVVPLVDVPDTLGWEDPVPDPAAPFGWTLLGLKVLLITVIVKGILGLIRAWRAWWDARRPNNRAKTLAYKGVKLNARLRGEEAIAVFDQVINHYGDDPTPAAREGVAMALVNKGDTLAQLERGEEAIAVYDKVVNDYGDDPTPAIRERVAMALVHKGKTLAQLQRREEAIAVYDQVINDYGDDPTPAIWRSALMARHASGQL